MRRIIAWFLVIFNINKIDKETKLIIYKGALKTLQLATTTAGKELIDRIGFCYTLMDATTYYGNRVVAKDIAIKISDADGSHSGMYLWFPEIFRLKPFLRYGDNYWFDPYDHTERIKLLEGVIKKLEKDVRKKEVRSKRSSCS